MTQTLFQQVFSLSTFPLNIRTHKPKSSLLKNKQTSKILYFLDSQLPEALMSPGLCFLCGQASWKSSRSSGSLLMATVVTTVLSVSLDVSLALPSVDSSLFNNSILLTPVTQLFSSLHLCCLICYLLFLKCSCF